MEKLLKLKNVLLSLDHNAHKAVYQSVAEYIEDGNYDPEDFINDDVMKECIEKNECWILTFYPHTPVGFYTIIGYDLNQVIDHALKIEC